MVPNAVNTSKSNAMNRRTSDRGFAVLGALVAVLVVAAIGGGAYYASQHADFDWGANATSTAPHGKGSLRAVAALGQNVTCEFESEDGRSSGKVFVAGGKVRGDFETEVEGKGDVESHLIQDGQYAYVWSDSMSGQGVKAKTSAAASAQLRQAGALDWDAQVSYECDEWDADEDKFEVPSGTTFLDLGATLGGSATTSANGGSSGSAGMGAGASANAGANVGVGAGSAATGSAGVGLDVRGILNY